jgi:peptidoglycan/LPS O-acetylase OafA/YrhL
LTSRYHRREPIASFDLQFGVARMSEQARELSSANYLADSHRPGFDGLRGIGFLMVVTAHIPSGPGFADFPGWAGVWIFLVISGYLLTMLMLREEKQHHRIAFGPFLVRRFFRIVPSYWLAILIYWVACYTLPALADEYQAFMERLPYYLAFMPEYAHTNVFTIFVHTWTVGIELKFYLFFPPLVFLLIKDVNWRLGATVVAVAALLANGSFIANSYVALLFGVMLAFLLERPESYGAIATLTRVPVVVPLVFVAVLFWVLRYSESWPAVTLVATYVVAYVIIQRGAMLRVLSFRPLVYLGQRSYGAYLLHVLAIHIGYMVFGNDTKIAGLLTACFCLAVTIPAAELLYRVVERPGMDFARSVVARTRAPKPSA